MEGTVLESIGSYLRKESVWYPALCTFNIIFFFLLSLNIHPTKLSLQLEKCIMHGQPMLHKTC